jgi:hypothetical protein
MNKNATFREQVLEFWRWFPTVAQPLARQLQAGQGLDGLGFDFAAEVRDKVGGLAWVFGPGEDESRFSFTVTGEGQKAKQLLSQFWLSQAVEVPGWDFYCARQPSPPDQLVHLAIDVGGNSVDAETLMIATEVVDEANAVNIKAWHDAFEHVPDEARFQILYLLLDEALGEYGTQTKLGEIQFQSDSAARPLVELPGYLQQLWSEKGWEDVSPLESYAGYRAEPGEGFDRADTIAGYTCVPQVVLGYLNNEGRLEDDPVENTGAEYLFVQIEADAFSSEDPLEDRTAVEEEIAKRLYGAGYVVGGATGTHNMYIDLVTFDGNRSRAAIEEALHVKHLHGKYQLKSFVT